MNEITAFAYDTYWLGLRTTRRFFRVPANVVSIIFFPLIQLLVFSQLYKDIVQLPAFATDSYLAYLAPGQVVFASFLAVGWAGYGMLVEYRSGYLDKLRATPIARIVHPRRRDGAAVLRGGDHGRRAARRERAARSARWRPALGGLLLILFLSGVFGIAFAGHQLHRRPAHQERAGGQRALAAHVPGGLHLDGLRAGRADAGLDAERQRLEPGHVSDRGDPRPDDPGLRLERHRRCALLADAVVGVVLLTGTLWAFRRLAK